MKSGLFGKRTALVALRVRWLIEHHELWKDWEDDRLKLEGPFGWRAHPGGNGEIHYSCFLAMQKAGLVSPTTHWHDFNVAKYIRSAKTKMTAN